MSRRADARKGIREARGMMLASLGQVVSPGPVPVASVLQVPPVPNTSPSRSLVVGVLAPMRVPEVHFDWAFQEVRRVVRKLEPSEMIIFGDWFGLWVARSCDYLFLEDKRALRFRLVGCPGVPCGDADDTRELHWFEWSLLTGSALEVVELKPDCVESLAAAHQRVVGGCDVLVLVSGTSGPSSVSHCDIVHIDYLLNRVERIRDA